MLCDYSVLLPKPEMISTNKCISDGESMIMTLKKRLHPTGGGRGGQHRLAQALASKHPFQLSACVVIVPRV